MTNDTILVSITNPGEPIAKIHETKHLHIFRMQFWDLDNDEGNIKAPDRHSFDGIKRFIDAHTQVPNIFIHCGAGISRSAAVAWSICDYLHLTDLEGRDFSTYATTRYIPNRRVKALCDIALEKGETDE
jgi:predicted protein tyrosine phosphatase